MEQNPFPEQKKKTEKARQVSAPKNEKGRQAAESQPKPGGINK